MEGLTRSFHGQLGIVTGKRGLSLYTSVDDTYLLTMAGSRSPSLTAHFIVAVGLERCLHLKARVEVRSNSNNNILAPVTSWSVQAAASNQVSVPYQLESQQ